jgi:hypothetical protein
VGAIISQVAASAPDEAEEEVTEPETETEKDETPMEIQAAAEVVIPTSPIFAQARKEPRIPNSWEYMAAFHKGGDSWVNAQKVFKDYTDFHRDPMVTAAAGDEFLTSVPGLLTQVSMGPVFQDINFMRPVVSALGARAMPSSPSSTLIDPRSRPIRQRLQPKPKVQLSQLRQASSLTTRSQKRLSLTQRISPIRHWISQIRRPYK